MNVTLQPAVLRWARERAGLSEDALAQKVGTKTTKVRVWEETGQLTFNQAEKLSKATHTPFGYLYLESPPDERLPIPDFRTVGTAQMQRPSPDLLDTLDDAQERQDWYRDYLLRVGEEPLAFVGSITDRLNPIEAAVRIRLVLSWDTALRSEASTWEDALSLQMERADSAGILVMRSGIVRTNTHRPLSVAEFRGFALSDPYAPLVFLNGKDAKAAQMFTLAHEVVHIWLGASGVSNLESTYAGDNRIEQFCNKVAAELLLPREEAVEMWNAVRALPNAQRLAALTRHFKVSSLVILRRAHDLGLIEQEAFWRWYREEEQTIRESAPASSGGDFYATQRSRIGRRFATALIESTLEGHTLYRDAFRMLGTGKVETFNQFARELGFSV
jgi:Zn-dependent peptidase ImmA (M78 family)